MKKTFLFIILFIFIGNYSYSQDDSENSLIVDGKLNIDSLYDKKDELIIVIGIHSFDSVSKSELLKKVKHWGGTNFVNLKEVLVGETEDQLVFNYITKSFYIKTILGKEPLDWYIRLVVQFKDGKIRCTFYDDGNARWPATQYSAAMPARSIKLKDYFRERDGIFVDNSKNRINGLVSLRNSIEQTFISIKEDILNTQSKSDDW